MPINITMPALSPTMEEGNLAKWLVKEGDKVKSGDVIAEIETDKATMEVEAVDEGTVAKIVVPAGTEGVKVNAVIAVLAADGEDAGAAAKGGEAAPVKQDKAPISPPVGEMSAKQTEGGAVPPTSPPKAGNGKSAEDSSSTLPPSGLPAISPTGGRSANHPAPSLRRLPAASPRTQASMSPRSAAPARTAVSSRPMSRQRSPEAAPRLHRRPSRRPALHRRLLPPSRQCRTRRC